ncbi:MAG: pyridoxamine 5'-phosphate oxidase family protein [Acidimicrobiia bacterium]|nr:pyridoxamine 5'-phosphate oxidase family protein [Acidimicrobiia bacterium]
MSIPVAIPDLAGALDGYGWAYLLTVKDDLRPHTVAVTPTWSRDALVMEVGRGSAVNAAARSSITLCYPPLESDGYSLIVDGQATVDGSLITFTPSTAVLHRPAPAGFEGSASGCGNDCRPVTQPPP